MRTGDLMNTRPFHASAGWQLPGRWSAAVFAGKVALLRLRRGVQDVGTGPPRLQRQPGRPAAPVVAESRTPLWSDPRVAEHAHQRGKVHNLRRAIQALDGIVIPAGQTFSFWRQLGRASRARGFVYGRMLQQGCMVPAVGGGLCQLSNALYDAALQAGCAIVERHAHSRLVPGSVAMQGRDATVAWNYVDLRFRPGQTLHLAIQLTADELVLRLLGGGNTPALPPAASPDDRVAASSCAACAETRCFRHEPGPPPPPGGQLLLVDEAWPEFVGSLHAARQEGSTLGQLLPNRLARLGHDRWPTEGYARHRATPAAALARSLAVRFASPGAATRQAQIAGAARIAGSLARLLTPDTTDLWVAQSYLPHLWRAGHLGGRRFSVLLTRLPMHLLEARLDAAFLAHPDRATLADYRAPPNLVEWEAEALARAESILTPHAELAAMFPGRAIRPPWCLPRVPPLAPVLDGSVPFRRIAFPGPTLARKGAHEVREAARALDLEVVLLGAELEGAGFWRGVRTRRPDPGRHPCAWLDGVAAVVQPALVEDQPRRLLAAREAGIPVLATAACGLGGSGVIEVAPLDPAGLTDLLRLILSPARASTP